MTAKNGQTARRAERGIQLAPAAEYVGRNGLLFFPNPGLNALENCCGLSRGGSLQSLGFEKRIHRLIETTLSIQVCAQLVPGANSRIRITGRLFQQFPSPLLGWFERARLAFQSCPREM